MTAAVGVACVSSVSDQRFLRALPAALCWALARMRYRYQGQRTVHGLRCRRASKQTSCLSRSEKDVAFIAVTAQLGAQVREAHVQKRAHQMSLLKGNLRRGARAVAVQPSTRTQSML